MSQLICPCGAIIPDDSVGYHNACNEEGEDYHMMEAYCAVCNSEFECSDWGECDSLEEAKETLVDKTELTQQP